MNNHFFTDRKQKMEKSILQIKGLLKGTLSMGWPIWVFFIIFFLAVFGPKLAPYDPFLFDPMNSLKPPSLSHPMGLDQYGRDVFSRMIIGTRSLATVTLGATVIAMVIGSVWGLLAAFLGKYYDEILMRIVDILISIPVMIVAVLLISMLGPSENNIIIAVAIVYSPFVSRVIRSEALVIMSQEFIDAARITGENSFFIISREMLPNLLHILFIEGAMRFGFVVLLVASLGFLGLGVQPPTPDWGLMISESRNYMRIAPWLIIFPACGLGVFVIASHSLADKISDRKHKIQ